VALSSEAVKDYVSSSLGEPIVKVELDAQHYQLAQDRTLRDFSRFRPKEGFTSYIMPRGVTEVLYPAGASGPLWIEGIVDEQAIDGISIESAMLSNPWAFISTGTPAVQVFDYELQKQWLEQVGRTFGNTFDYHIFIDEAKVYVYCPYEYKVTITWGYSYTNVSEIPDAYMQLFLDLSLAKARQILGHIRNKFSGVPGAGTTITLDGPYQLQKGEADEKEYIEELRKLSSHYTPQMV
jgi:hypothetical protein